DVSHPGGQPGLAAGRAGARGVRDPAGVAAGERQRADATPHRARPADLRAAGGGLPAADGAVHGRGRGGEGGRGEVSRRADAEHSAGADRGGAEYERALSPAGGRGVTEKRYDPTLKVLVETEPESWPALLGVPTGPTAVIDADLSTVRGAADKVLRVEADP